MGISRREGASGTPTQDTGFGCDSTGPAKGPASPPGPRSHGGPALRREEASESRVSGSRPGRGPQSRSGQRRTGLPRGTAAVALFILVPVIAAGGLVTQPLNVTGHTQLVFGLLALGSLPALRRTRWWRDPAPVLLVVFWAVFWALSSRALAVAPNWRLGRRELLGLAVCTFVSLAAVALSRGSRLGLQAFRWGWVVALLLTGGIGVWEVFSGRHLWTPQWSPWRFGDGSVISSTFINPNNFSDALVGMLAGVVALWARAGSRRVLRAVLALLAVFAATLMVFTESRGGLVGLALIAGLEVVRRRRLMTGARPLREVLADHRQMLTAAAVGVLAVIAATFLVPALAARNPLRATIALMFTDEQSRSDLLRIRLIKFAFGYLRDSGWTGSGAGSFEPLFWNDPARGALPATNLHNSFVELLTQYGVLVFAPYLALLLVLVATLFRRGIRSVTSAVEREQLLIRNELAGHLMAFTLLGTTASSALEIPFWWLSLANAAALAWYLRAHHPTRSHARASHR